MTSQLPDLRTDSPIESTLPSTTEFLQSLAEDVLIMTFDLHEWFAAFASSEKFVELSSDRRKEHTENYQSLCKLLSSAEWELHGPMNKH